MSTIYLGMFDNDILILVNGIPRGLDEFSPINTKKRERKRFFVVTNRDERIRSTVCKYMKDKFSIDNTDCKF